MYLKFFGHLKILNLYFFQDYGWFQKKLATPECTKVANIILFTRYDSRTTIYACAKAI